MTWTPDYKKDIDRIKKAKLEKLNPTNTILPFQGQSSEATSDPGDELDAEAEEAAIGQERPTEKIKAMIQSLHSVSQPRGIYGDLFLDLAEEIIMGITSPGDQIDIGNNILSKLKKSGFRLTTAE